MRRVTHVRRHPFLLAWLALVWIGLWGSASAANVAGGIAVAVCLLVLLPLPESTSAGRVRPLALALFVAVFLLELVKASLIVVWQVLRPGAELRQAVIAVDAVGASDRLLTMIANSISLTPGTLSLEIDRDRSLIYVHALDVGGPDGVEGARRSIERLMHLAVRAIGSAENLQRLDEAARRRGESAR